MSEGKKPSRPGFQAVSKITAFKNPEELFSKLAGRSKSHAYLRGPQQDVLRAYADEFSTAPNLAAELPTGTGKTAVGLLIAEWQRQQGKRVAYLSLTNQLAGQVVDEATRLTIPTADLRGTNKTRSTAEEGRFRTQKAVGVSTYSNLFNNKPVIDECDLLILDDAHGAEAFVADMWTVTVTRTKHAGLYQTLLKALRPGLSESQLSGIMSKRGIHLTEMVDLVSHPECLPPITEALNAATEPKISFPWQRIGDRLYSCLHFVSAWEISIRPLIPPTHIHSAFASPTQRIYMSATLGGQSDLMRAYCIEQLKVVRAKSQQWGRRYVFVPGVSLAATDTQAMIRDSWEAMAPRRAVLLAPSETVMDRMFKFVNDSLTTKPARFSADDIQDSVDGFVAADPAFLTLAGRYDGLDLPDDKCRLLVMAESPAATNSLERHLSEKWKLGPVLRKRERTRLVQGMGRCTRSATDFSVILWLGQSLINAATSKPLLRGMPAELAAEIQWGLAQVSSQSGDDLVAMIEGLLSDGNYRQAADAAISDLVSPSADGPAEAEDYEKAGPHEVHYAKAMWDEDYGRAMKSARTIADSVTAQELSGYRAWWWYLASIPAGLAKSTDAERDALNRGSHCTVNAGWIKRVLISRSAGAAVVSTDQDAVLNAEGVFDVLADWGWAGMKFADKTAAMIERLLDPYHATFHLGLAELGSCLGATVTHTTEQGAPDVVWSFDDDLHFTFEAKTEKRSALSKNDLLEAKGHVEWVQARLADKPSTAKIFPLVVSSAAAVLEVGAPYTKGLFHLKPDDIHARTVSLVGELSDLRVQFSGRDYADAAKEFAASLKAKGLDLDAIAAWLTASPLK